MFCAHRACRLFAGLWTMRAVDCCTSGSGRVTGNTLCIVKAGLSNQRLMRIMTGYASDSRVGPDPASTFRQPVGLESDVERGIVFRGGHIRRRTMTGATKIYKFYWAERCRIKNCVNPGSELFGLHRFYMPNSRAMASLTSNSRGRVIRVELSPYRRRGRVTCETLLSCLRALRRPEGVLQIVWRTSRMFGRYVKATNRWEIAELTLKKHSQVAQDKGLTFDSRTH